MPWGDSGSAELDAGDPAAAVRELKAAEGETWFSSQAGTSSSVNGRRTIFSSSSLTHQTVVALGSSQEYVWARVRAQGTRGNGFC